MRNSLKYTLCLSLIALTLGGCASIKNMKLPSFSLPHMPEQSETPKNIGSFPAVANAQKAPTGLRSDAQWDSAARKILRQRDAFALPDDLSPAKTEAQILQEMQNLRTKVEEYKRDDPQ